MVIGSVPAAVLGLLLDDWAHDSFYSSAYTVAAMLILCGIIFIVIGRYNRRRKGASWEWWKNQLENTVA